MELHIVIEGRKDLAQQLYRQLRDAIESGRLASGTQLPPSRLLAEQLGISRKTVADTYALLTYEGRLEGRIGRGTFVTAQAARPARSRFASELAAADFIRFWEDLPMPFRHPTLEGTQRYEFIGGATARHQFPHDDWRRCTQHALRQMAGVRGFYGQPEGVGALREGIARHISFARGVRCVADDVVVCNGAQQALDLLARIMLRPGCIVAMEDPGYTPARLLFSTQGAQVVGVPVDREGIRVEAIPEGTRLIYVTPSHQFPLGMPMSPARREALLQRARQLGAIVIEDDYDSEFRYEGRPTDSLQSMDEHGVVAYVGTFSKTLLPELRLGYAILPEVLLEPMIKLKQITDWHSSTLPQWALAKFIDDGLLHKHIRRCHGVYSGRRERILARVAGDLAPWFEAVPTVAGAHMALLCRTPVDIPRLIDEARQVEVGLHSLAPFYFDQAPQPGLLLGFGAIETLDIDPALDRVRDILLRIT